GLALPHAHQAPTRPWPGPRAFSRAHRAAARIPEARTAAVAAPAHVPPRRRTAGRRPRVSAAGASPLRRVPRSVLVRRGHVRAPARAWSRARDRRPPAGERLSDTRADRGLDVYPLPQRHARAAWELLRIGAARVGG